MLFKIQHLITAWAVLEALMNFKERFKFDMELNNMDSVVMKKCLLVVKLMDRPSQVWATKDEAILRIVISYVMFQLAHCKEELDECFYEVDKLARKDQKQSIIEMDDYLRYRRSFFELVKMVDYLIKKDDDYQIVYVDDKTIDVF